MKSLLHQILAACLLLTMAVAASDKRHDQKPVCLMYLTG